MAPGGPRSRSTAADVGRPPSTSAVSPRPTAPISVGRLLHGAAVEVDDHDTLGALGGEPPDQRPPMPLAPPVTTATCPAAPSWRTLSAPGGAGGARGAPASRPAMGLGGAAPWR